MSLDNEFTDVTLALEDGQLVEAHKVILTGCSAPNLIIWVSNIKLFTFHARVISGKSHQVSDWRQIQRLWRWGSNKIERNNKGIELYPVFISIRMPQTAALGPRSTILS